MKRIIGLSLLILLFSFVPTQAQQVNLPNDCLKILNKKFRGWKLVKMQMEEGVLGHNLIKGDWNGDKKTDYAILIERSNPNDVWVIAFIKKQSGYSFHKIDGGDSIFLMKKGAKDYNYETQKNFTYKNDAIFVGTGCCGSSYIWRKGKFIGFVTSD